MKKISLCLLFGGASLEHEISKKSAYNIFASLDKTKYHIHLVMITKGGKWLYLPSKKESITSNTWMEEGTDVLVSPSTDHKGLIKLSKDGYKTIDIDVFFPVFHGQNGEDGVIQGLLELTGIPYVGSGVLGSAVCMDKCVAKSLLVCNGIPQTGWITLRSYQKTDFDLIEQTYKYPYFIKPANSGSSIGIFKVKNRAELLIALKDAFDHDTKVILEESIEDALEIEICVIGNESPIASTYVGEIIPANEFYDYDAKYISDSKLVIPAVLNENLSEKIKERALLAYKICECRGMARIDFLVSNNEVYLNEINTIPGFTDISMFPRLWNQEGMSTTHLLDKLVEFAVKSKSIGKPAVENEILNKLVGSGDEK